MSAVSILSTWKWEHEGHPHLSWQTQNALLVNKLIFWKVTICLKFLSSSCHLELEMECHFARQGCSQSCWSCVCVHLSIPWQNSLPDWDAMGCWFAAGSGQERSLIPEFQSLHPAHPACWELENILCFKPAIISLAPFCAAAGACFRKQMWDSPKFSLCSLSHLLGGNSDGPGFLGEYRAVGQERGKAWVFQICGKLTVQSHLWLL